MSEPKPFEILTVDGSCFRFNDFTNNFLGRSVEPFNYRWQYALEQGSIDRLDKTVVEVFKLLDDDEDELIRTYSQVVAAGAVTADKYLAWPRTRRETQCPRCGYVELEDKTK